MTGTGAGAVETEREGKTTTDEIIKVIKHVLVHIHFLII